MVEYRFHIPDVWQDTEIERWVLLIPTSKNQAVVDYDANKGLSPSTIWWVSAYSHTPSDRCLLSIAEEAWR